MVAPERTVVRNYRLFRRARQPCSREGSPLVVARTGSVAACPFQFDHLTRFRVRRGSGVPGRPRRHASRASGRRRRRRPAPSPAARDSRSTAIGPLTVPLITTCETRISPSTRACSLTTSVPGSPLAAITLPRTWPSMRKPPVNVTSPWTTVPAPIRLSMRFCGDVLLTLPHGGSSGEIQTPGGARVGLARFERARGHAIAPGRRAKRERRPQPADNT